MILTPPPSLFLPRAGLVAVWVGMACCGGSLMAGVVVQVAVIWWWVVSFSYELKRGQCAVGVAVFGADGIGLSRSLAGASQSISALHRIEESH